MQHSSPDDVQHFPADVEEETSDRAADQEHRDYPAKLLFVTHFEFRGAAVTG